MRVMSAPISEHFSVYDYLSHYFVMMLGPAQEGSSLKAEELIKMLRILFFNLCNYLNIFIFNIKDKNFANMLLQFKFLPFYAY